MVDMLGVLRSKLIWTMGVGVILISLMWFVIMQSSGIDEGLVGAIILYILLVLVFFKMRESVSSIEKKSRFERDFKDLPIEEREEELMKLIKDDLPRIRGDGAAALYKYFKDISESTRDDALVLLASDKVYALRENAVNTLVHYFSDISEPVREKLLLGLADDVDEGKEIPGSGVGYWVVITLINDFEYISNGAREEVLKKLALNQNPYTKRDLIFVLNKNSRKIPEDLRDYILNKLGEDENEMVRKAAKNVHDLPAASLGEFQKAVKKL